MAIAFVIIGVLWLSYSNGANDNFKGVATIYGSGTTSFRKTLLWATMATAAGCVGSVFFAGKLVTVVSGEGIRVQDCLVPDQ